MSKFFNSREQYKIQKRKNAKRNRLRRRKARHELEKRLIQEAKDRAAASKLAESLSQLVVPSAKPK